MENVITNYSDFFFERLKLDLLGAVGALNYSEAYEGFSDENSSRCIMDGSAMSPHFRVLFSEKQDRAYVELTDDYTWAGEREHENIMSAWDDALARLSTLLESRPAPEGIEYYVSEENGCVYVEALGCKGSDD